MQFSTLVSVVFSFAAVICAQTNGQNSITSPLGGTLGTDVPVTIRWTPTTSGTITLKLMKGPPANIIDIAVIAASIENSGSYTWRVPNTLQDSSTMPLGNRYGIKIIDDSTSTFEYSPPFDISVSDSTSTVAESASKSASVSATATQTTTSTSAVSSTSATATQTATSNKSTPAVSSTSAGNATTTGSTSIAESTTTSQSTTVPSSESASLLSMAVAEPTTTAAGATQGTVATTLATSATTANTTGTAGSSSKSTGVKKGPSVIHIIGIAAGAAVFLGVSLPSS